MSLLDDARQAHRPNGINCVVQKLRLSDPALYAELMEALASEVECSAISVALHRKGVDMDGNVLTRHRRGNCARCRS